MLFGKSVVVPAPITISDEAIKRIDAMLQEGAEAKAELRRRRENEKAQYDRTDYAALCRTETSPVLPTPTPPRLEPFYGEVKEAAKFHKISEKEAERMIRKNLLECYINTLGDDKSRTLARALLNFL